MNRYLIVSPHEAGDCKKAIQQVVAAGYITHFDWGCSDSDHTGWMILEAADAKEALMVVPSFFRPKAKAVRLVKFNKDGAAEAH